MPVPRSARSPFRASFRFETDRGLHTQDHGADIPELSLVAALRALVALVREDEATWAKTPWPKGIPLLRDMRLKWVEIEDRERTTYLVSGRRWTWDEIRAQLAHGGTADATLNARFARGLAEHDRDLTLGIGGIFVGEWQTGFPGEAIAAQATDRLFPNLAATIAVFPPEDAALLRRLTRIEKIPASFLG